MTHSSSTGLRRHIRCGRSPTSPDGPDQSALDHHSFCGGEFSRVLGAHGRLGRAGRWREYRRRCWSCDPLGSLGNGSHGGRRRHVRRCRLSVLSFLAQDGKDCQMDISRIAPVVKIARALWGRGQAAARGLSTATGRSPHTERNMGQARLTSHFGVNERHNSDGESRKG